MNTYKIEPLPNKRKRLKTNKKTTANTNKKLLLPTDCLGNNDALTFG